MRERSFGRRPLRGGAASARAGQRVLRRVQHFRPSCVHMLLARQRFHRGVASVGVNPVGLLRVEQRSIGTGPKVLPRMQHVAVARR